MKNTGYVAYMLITDRDKICMCGRVYDALANYNNIHIKGIWNHTTIVKCNSILMSNNVLLREKITNKNQSLLSLPAPLLS